MTHFLIKLEHFLFNKILKISHIVSFTPSPTTSSLCFKSFTSLEGSIMNDYFSFFLYFYIIYSILEKILRIHNRDCIFSQMIKNRNVFRWIFYKRNFPFILKRIMHDKLITPWSFKTAREASCLMPAGSLCTQIA